MNAPARAWSSSGDRPNIPPRADKYGRYTTWPQNARKAARASHGNVARKRYNGSVHGRVAKPEWITGYQNRSPARKNWRVRLCANSEIAARAQRPGERAIGSL